MFLKKSKEKTTKPFTVDEMNALFNSPFFTGCQNDEAPWPAAGFVDTEIRCLTELESWNAEKEVQPRVQA